MRFSAGSGGHIHVTKMLIGVAVVLAAVVFVRGVKADDDGHVHWTLNVAPVTTAITGGPWTLEQLGAANGLKSAKYCDSTGIQIGNTGTERMQPYYFPTVFGHGKHLQGYFDWRPKDIDEG